MTDMKLRQVENDPNADIFSWIFNQIEDLPIINFFVPLLKMLTWQYAAVPWLISLILDMIMVLTGWIVINVIRGI